MYFWNIKSLKKEIIEGKLSDDKVIPYIVLYAGLYAIGGGAAGVFSLWGSTERMDLYTILAGCDNPDSWNNIYLQIKWRFWRK